MTSQHPADLIGTTLGEFELAEVIGSNPFAWVFRATDAQGASVALKVLKPQYRGELQYQTQFQNELDTLSALSHPNIVKLFGPPPSSGRPDWFAMKYYPMSLSDRLKEHGRLAEAELVTLALDLGEALHHAHEQGLVHRDIKPDNIRYDDGGRAILADFGIAAKAKDSAAAFIATGTNMTIGTPHYLSPEQAQGMALDGRSDLYSLGVTLFRAATGELPFRSSDWFELARQHVEEPPASPRRDAPHISRRMERVILKLLEKRPEDRYQSAEALCQELRSLRETSRSTESFGVGAPAALKTSPVAGRQWLRRVGALVFVIVVALLVAWLGSR